MSDGEIFRLLLLLATYAIVWWCGRAQGYQAGLDEARKVMGENKR